MDDDLAVPQALAAVHDTVRRGNSALTDGDLAAVREARDDVRAMMRVLGLDPGSAPWHDDRSSGEQWHGVVEALVENALLERQAARARQDFAAADAVRDRLSAAGIAIEDTPGGSRWSRKDDG
jgi:cysteinyl-tRNA synthetase